MFTSYLTEALYGNYNFLGENRLSQAFSSSYNHSVLFQKAVMDFFDLKFQRSLKSETQYAFPKYKNPALIDILIFNRNRTHIVIENKIDAPLTRHQLHKYDKITEIRRCKKICFVKHYKSVVELKDNWSVRYWGDFYIHLEMLKEKDFVIANFIELLKEYGMERPSVILKKDLKSLATTLKKIRFDNKPDFIVKSSEFETMLAFKLMMEDVFRKAAKETVLTKRAGKTFRAKMSFSWWYDKNKKVKEWLWFGCQTTLKKEYKGIKNFGAALLLYDENEKYDVVAYISEQSGDWIDYKCYPKKDLNCLDFESMAIKFWKLKLK